MTAKGSGERWLWLLRHAKAVPAPPAGGTDHDRPLSARGRRDCEALGHHLGDDGDRLGLAAEQLPELVLCSTATRATETVDGVFAQMSRPPQVLYVRSLYSASPDDVLEEVAMVEDERRSVMVVGHNPTTEALVLELLAAATDGSPVEADRPGGRAGLIDIRRKSPDSPEGSATRVRARQRLERRGFPTCGLAVFGFVGDWQAVLREPPAVVGLFVPPY